MFSGATKVPVSVILRNTPNEEAIKTYLAHFGATLEKGAVFKEKTGMRLAISKALFTTGADKDGGAFKWDDVPHKDRRLPYVNLLAEALKNPDEIWWRWERHPHNKDNWRLVRRYLKVFEIEGQNEYAITAFEWSKNGWTGSTAFVSKSRRQVDSEKYFNQQRVGKLLYKK